MFDRTIWEATSANTLIHRWDARTKLTGLALCAAAVVIVDSPRSLFVLFLSVLALHLAAKTPIARWRVMCVLILLGMWGTMISQALFYSREPRTIIACLLPPDAGWIGSLTGGVYLYQEGLQHGAAQALRSAVMLGGGLLLCWTTDARELLKCLLYFRCPYELAFMVIAGLRFLPVVIAETAAVITAQRMRGGNPVKSLWPHRLARLALQTLFPILARAIRRAQTLALSVESRGFGRGARQVALPPWPVSERWACYLLVTVILLAAVLKLAYVLQYNGLVFIPALRRAYDFIMIWM